MSASAHVDLFAYTVTYMLPGDPAPASKTMPAAYFVEDGALTLFKDDRHQAVFAIRTESVVSVSRGASV